MNERERIDREDSIQHKILPDKRTHPSQEEFDDDGYWNLAD